VKKKIVTVILVICMAVIYMPVVSRAAISPHFIGVGNTLLPFNDDTMPYVANNVLYVPFWIFSEAGIWSIGATELERVRIYKSDRHVDFYAATGVTEDQNGNTLQWPAPRIVGKRFYVPLTYVCDFFGLTYRALDIGRDIIPQEQMRIIRIMPAEGFTGLNDQTFISVHRSTIIAAYNSYYPPPPPESPPTASPWIPPTPPVIVEPPPKYNDVTIYHSFYDISADGIDVIMELLEASRAPDYRFCFFVSADDIREDAGLIRRIASSGHAIGIWLKKGTYDEYLETSAMLFEAAKIVTLLVAADGEAEDMFVIPDDKGIIFWRMSQSFMYDDTLSVDEVKDMITCEHCNRQNLISSCSVNTALMLSGVLSHLREFEYSIGRITETVDPPQRLSAETDEQLTIDD